MNFNQFIKYLQYFFKYNFVGLWYSNTYKIYNKHLNLSKLFYTPYYVILVEPTYKYILFFFKKNYILFSVTMHPYTYPFVDYQIYFNNKKKILFLANFYFFLSKQIYFQNLKKIIPQLFNS